MIKDIVKKFVYTKEDNLLSHVFTSMPFKDEIVLVDIGAAGDIEPRWKKIEKHLLYYGFEPNIDSYKKLKIKPVNVKHRKLFQTALWDSDCTLEINMCSNPKTSSYFNPNFSFLDRFSDKERYEIDKIISIKCNALDNLEIDNCDFLKIDVQGGELAILQGASKTLNSAFGIEAEVEFIELYQGQPLFGEVAKYLNRFGFDFIDLIGTCRWERKSSNQKYKGLFGQLVFGDALFLKSPETVIENYKSLERIANYLKILLLYRRFDLIEKLLENIDFKDRELFNKFEKNIIRLKKRFIRARQISILSNRMLELFGLNYKSHLIY